MTEPTDSPEIDPIAEESAAIEEMSNDETYSSMLDQIETLTRERDQANDEHLRLLAEFQNFRRQQELRAAQDRRYATEKLVRDLLPVLDNFDRSLEAIDAGAPLESIREGVSAISKQMMTALESQQVVRIVALGQPFDPEVHEAVATEASSEPENTVIQELRSGYQMAERVIRPAMVKVAKSE